MIVISTPEAGADITTLSMDELKCREADSLSLKSPVLSTTISTSTLSHGISEGLLLLKTFIS